MMSDPPVQIELILTEKIEQWEGNRKVYKLVLRSYINHTEHAGRLAILVNSEQFKQVQVGQEYPMSLSFTSSKDSQSSN